MKYTRYILHDSLNFEGFGVIAIPAAVLALPFMTVLLCGAWIMDSGRIIKLKYLLWQRALRHLNYIKCVLRSLDRAESRENINLLKAA
jgi:hypothetical protein